MGRKWLNTYIQSIEWEITETGSEFLRDPKCELKQCQVSGTFWGYERWLRKKRLEIEPKKHQHLGAVKGKKNPPRTLKRKDQGGLSNQKDDVVSREVRWGVCVADLWAPLMSNCPVAMVALMISTHQGPCSETFWGLQPRQLGWGSIKEEGTKSKSFSF